MRQVGYLAAAGIYALDHNIDRLSDDHRRARVLGRALESCPWVSSVEPVETNIVIFQLHSHLEEEVFLNYLEERQIKLISMGEGKLRIVTHLDFTDAMLEQVLEVLKEIPS